MNTEIQTAVSNALRGQSWFVRRKDTIAAVAGTIVQVLNLVVFMTTGAPEWVNGIIAVAVGVAQAFVHAATPGAITPSMEKRLEQAALQPAPVTADTTAYSEGEQAAKLFAQATPNSEDPEHEAVVHDSPHEHGSGR